jgi:hypothetical protein
MRFCKNENLVFLWGFLLLLLYHCFNAAATTWQQQQGRERQWKIAEFLWTTLM